MLKADLDMLERDFPVSHALLWHDDLMTSRLIAHFGAVHARQTAVSEDRDTVTRWSTLCQTASRAPLLQARLVIRKSVLPEGLLAHLFAGTRLFGALLIEASIGVRMADRTIYCLRPPEGAQGQVRGQVWGRRQRMLLAEGDQPLCDVDECLVDETTLKTLLV